jgi:pimeloyl-ACP methyl ester carboxylesterase
VCRETEGRSATALAVCYNQLGSAALSTHSGGGAMKITANGTSMNYQIAGDGDWLVLIHGAGDNLQAWYNQVPAFSKQYKVLTYDTRGHGQTDVTEREYTTGTWADDLHALLIALGVRRASVLG